MESFKEIGSIVSFTMHGSGVLPPVNKGKVIGVLSAGYIKEVSTAATTHSNVYSAAMDPTGIYTEYDTYDYLIVDVGYGTLLEIGLPWIISESIESFTSQSTATVVIRNYDPANGNLLLKVLSSIGMDDVTVSIT